MAVLAVVILMLFLLLLVSSSLYLICIVLMNTWRQTTGWSRPCLLCLEKVLSMRYWRWCQSSHRLRLRLRKWFLWLVSLLAVALYTNCFSCTKTFSANSSSQSRPLCECDRKLIGFLSKSVPDPNLIGYPATSCNPAAVVSETGCCNYNDFMWESYKVDVSSCCLDGVKPIGTC